jgi:hypothetical protein
MRFIHAEVPLHFLLIVIQHLNQPFAERCRGRGGSVNWLAESSFLAALDVQLGRYRNTSLYSVPIDDIESDVSEECELMREEELKVVLKCAGTTQGVCHTDHTTIDHISVLTYFWSCITH